MNSAKLASLEDTINRVRTALEALAKQKGMSVDDLVDEARRAGPDANHTQQRALNLQTRLDNLEDRI